MLIVPEVMKARQRDIIEEWNRCIRAALGDRENLDALLRTLLPEASRLLHAITDAFEDSGTINADLLSAPSFESVRTLVAQISAARARDGLSPTETATFIGSLKEAVARTLFAGEMADAAHRSLQGFNDLVDRLAYASFAAYNETREAIIKRQSSAMLEMSTPVLNLWKDMVLMPLVGVIDTARAQQIMESLLDAVVRHEARVVILDITGVPVVDTSVARHLTLTVSAVQMLGAQVILTGISPETAQTLVKLDIDLSQMMTRGSLRAGLQEALRIIGQRIVAAG